MFIHVVACARTSLFFKSEKYFLVFTYDTSCSSTLSLADIWVASSFDSYEYCCCEHGWPNICSSLCLQFFERIYLEAEFLDKRYVFFFFKMFLLQKISNTHKSREHGVSSPMYLTPGFTHYWPVASPVASILFRPFTTGVPESKFQTPYHYSHNCFRDYLQQKWSRSFLGSNVHCVCLIIIIF